MKLVGNRSISLKNSTSFFYRAARYYCKNRSLRSWLQPPYYVYKRIAARSPLQATLATTYRCQAKCIHCHTALHKKSVSDEMSTEEWKHIVAQLKELGSLIVLFTGGEPLIRKDIIDLVAFAHSIGLITRIITNAYLLNREMAMELKKAGLNQCGVSIDSADPETHDKMRGIPGLHQRAIQALHYLNEVKLDSKIMAYASHRNITQDLKQIIQLGRIHKAKSLFINIPFAVGNWADSQHEVLSKKEMEQLRSFMDLTFVHLEFPTSETICCAYRKALVFINPSGIVTPCPVVPYAIGDLKCEPLASVWKRHVSALSLEYRGGCPMNEVKSREDLMRYAASVCGHKVLQEKMKSSQRS